jgi:hypothetical protein
MRSGEHRQPDYPSKDQQHHNSSSDRELELIVAPLETLGLGTAATLLNEKLLPILHAPRVSDEFEMESRLTGDGGVSAGGGAAAGHGPLGEVFCELRVPSAGRFADCTFRGHAFHGCPASIVKLVRLHWSPPK